MTNAVLLLCKTYCRLFINFRKFSSTVYNIDLKVANVSLNEYIKALEKEYAKSKDSGKLKPELVAVIDMLDQRKSVVNDINNLKELLQEKDSEIKMLADKEKYQFEQTIKSIDQKIINTLLEMNDDNKYKSIILEVNAGVGGQEAMLFAAELFDMYTKFAEYKGWPCQIAEYLTTDLGGCRHASAIIESSSAFQYFVHEAGVHRVQRIPITEKSGRIHTSTASVAVLPEPDDIQIQLNNKDLKIETKRATGAGGQHVNTTDSAVRIVHIPTGTSVECQIDRSQVKNREIALQRLRALLYNQQLEKQLAETEKIKKSQVRSNFRNERIRTYNFSQDRITDHRLQGCNYYNIKGFMVGEKQLESMIQKLQEAKRIKQLLDAVENFKNKT